MKRLLLLILLFLFSEISYAQERTFREMDSLAISYANDLLNNRNVDKILIYKSGCVGCEVIGDCTCHYGSLKTFLIWKETNSSYVKEMNCCETTDKEQTDISDVWNELETKQKLIFHSEFQSEIEVNHYSFHELVLLKEDSKEKVEMTDYHFEANNKYQKQNSNQPARKFQQLIEFTLVK